MEKVTESVYFGPVVEPKASASDGASGLRPVDPKMIGMRQLVLKTAGELIDGDRARDYGDAYEMHKRISVGWGEILGAEVKAHEVALCMAWLKLSRLVETPSHFDSYVDAVAYIAIAAEIQKRDSANAG
jgi:hypothetical protein